MISFVSPVYEAENTLSKLILEIEMVMLSIDEDFEIILIEDRSKDNSWKRIVEISKANPRVKSFRLSKNFGQHPAIQAGLKKCKGDWVVVLDCDLQDQPKEVKKLYDKAQEGYDIVLAKRKNRLDSNIKKLSSYTFAKIFGYFTDTKYDHQVANFGIYKYKTIEAVLAINDKVVFFPLFIQLVGFKSTSIEVEHGQRNEGNSSYTFRKLVSLAFNIIISFSNKPLKLMVKFGLIISMLSFLYGIYQLYLAITDKIYVLGYSSIIISIWLLSGIIITIIGICGIYLGKIFEQTKHRPNYIIDETGE